jgi:chromosome partitioning protein
MTKGYVITVAQQKGGAGKTTISAHLAVALSQKGYKVMILDVDQQASLSAWHKIREQKFGEGYTGLAFSAIAGWRASSHINSAKEDYDFVIIDSPPHTEADAKAVIRASNLVIVPVQPSPTDIWATQKTVEILKEEGIKFVIALNRVTPKSKLAADMAKKLPALLKSQLGNRVTFASSLLEGRCVTETHPTSTAAAEVKSFVAEILKIIANTKSHK